jgi:hypothetical protein
VEGSVEGQVTHYYLLPHEVGVGATGKRRAHKNSALSITLRARIIKCGVIGHQCRIHRACPL